MVENHISVPHGRMCIRVARSVFDDQGNPRPLEVTMFRETLSRRYPWLSRHALDIIMANAEEEMRRVIEEETTALDRAMDLQRSGELKRAVELLRHHLEAEPDDADAWYRLGEFLCRLGDRDEGYKAFARARKCR